VKIIRVEGYAEVGTELQTTNLTLIVLWNIFRVFRFVNHPAMQ